MAQDKEYEIHRFNDSTSIEIDGVFSESIWEVGEWESNFTQNSPDNGGTPSQKTAFKIFYDDNFIYVALKAYDLEPHLIDARMSRRDSWTGDRLAIEFDSFNDNRTGFIFCVNSAGVKNDGVITREDGIPDSTIDPIWYVKTKIVSDGWNAEMKIPLSQLKFSPDSSQKWGLQVVRFLFRNQEYDTWAHASNEISGWVNQYGTLTGLTKLKSRRQMEVAPFVLFGGDYDANRKSNPIDKVTQIKTDIGVNGKIGVNNFLTLDYAVNPDFGQVEADPSELNLSEFELFFRERRPFFLDGRNITSFSLSDGSGDDLFYSRRIGRVPQGYLSLSAGEFIQRPDRTRILGALKLTGKTKNGWSIGILESFTNKESATVGKPETQRKEAIEPYANYFVARVEKDFNKGNTVLGGVFSSTNRVIDDSNFSSFVSTAISGGVNVHHYFDKRKHYIGLRLVGSYIRGSEEAILNQQLSSRRLFQRPDADYLILNPDRRSLSGTGGTFSFGKRTNGGFNYSLLTTWRSPEFETNDLGFLRRANYIIQKLTLSYTFARPNSFYRRIRFTLQENAEWDFGGNNNKLNFSHRGSIVFKNLWSLNYIASKTSRNIKPTSLRGGPALHDVGFTRFVIDLATSRAKRFNMGINAWEAFNGSNTGKSWELSTRMHYRPINAFEIGMAAAYGDYHQDLQYIRKVAIENRVKYLFGAITQKTFNLILKLEYNVTPDFTIQYYGSPYITSGDLNNFKNVDDSDAQEYLDRFYLYGPHEISFDPESNYYNIQESGTNDFFSFRNPNFNFKDFRSNLVFRWEYKPGSELFLVWSRFNTNVTSNGDLNLKQSLNDLFSDSGRNIVMFKLSYRFQT